MGSENRCLKCQCWKPICRCDGKAGSNIHVFKPMVYNDICEHPILITGKKHLREECKKHDVVAARLL